MGTSSRFKFDHPSVRRRVVLALPSSSFQETLHARLTGDRHQVVTATERGAFEFTLALIAEGLGAPPGVIVAASGFADGEWMPILRRCREALRSTTVLVVDEGLDEEELDAIEDEGWITLRPPLGVEHVAFAVTHAEIWRFLRPSRALFERIVR